MSENRGTELLVVNIVFFSITAVIVLLRCYTRVFISKAFGLDDWLMALSTVSKASIESLNPSFQRLIF